METVGDGNCCFRALSLAALGTDCHYNEIRVLCACELAVNSANYLSAELVSKGTLVAGNDILEFCKAAGDLFLVPSLEVAFQCEVMTSVESSKEVGIWHLLAAANVLRCTITPSTLTLQRE
jgi:hypothetical protein